jgi:hypothetical protein
VLQPGRLGDAVHQQEALDLLLRGPGLAHRLVAESEDLPVSLLLGGRDADRVEQALLREHRQAAAVEAVALGRGAERHEQARGGDDLDREARILEAAGQAEAGRPRLVDDGGDPTPEWLEPLE